MPTGDGKPCRRSPKEDDEIVSSTENGTNCKSLRDEEDSNISVPTSDPDDKSNDSSLQNEAPLKDELNSFRHPSGNGRHHEEDSKDGLVPSSEENSRNNLFLGEDNSNLSNSNLSSGGDLTPSAGELNENSLSADRPIAENEPVLKKIRAE